MNVIKIENVYFFIKFIVSNGNEYSELTQQPKELLFFRKEFMLFFIFHYSDHYCKSRRWIISTEQQSNQFEIIGEIDLSEKLWNHSNTLVPKQISLNSNWETIWLTYVWTVEPVLHQHIIKSHLGFSRAMHEINFVILIQGKFVVCSTTQNTFSFSFLTVLLFRFYFTFMLFFYS